MNSAGNAPAPHAAGSGGVARFPCGQCAATLEFSPGAGALKCPYCGFENPVPRDAGVVAEHDYRTQLAALSESGPQIERLTARCGSCAAEIEPPASATAFECPYCGADVVATGASRKLIKPHAVLPFRVDRGAALAAFERWLRGLWFAPSAVKRFARLDHRFCGMYVPHWTYDCRTDSDYEGQRGDDYTVVETYTVTVNGRPETRTRHVTRTRWTSVSGSVTNRFDDLLVCASKSLPAGLLAQLEPWDLEQLAPYRDEYLSGFRAESYQVPLFDGFIAAQAQMKPRIHESIRADIGGDHQRIEQVRSRYNDVTFKHLLLPVWISVYRFRERVFRFVVNARTGEVRGERPFSWIKITLLVLAILAIIAVVALVVSARR